MNENGRMNPDYENELAAGIDRELKALPELLAPQTLAVRVMRAIHERAARPWYRQSWQRWPAGWQAAAFVLLVAVFGGLCYAGWQLPRAEQVAVLCHHAGQWAGLFSSIANILRILLGALLAGVKKLGTGFLAAGLAAIALAYALCLGLGTACVRLAYARRQQ